jgi:HK97 family phage portal protein
LSTEITIRTDGQASDYPGAEFCAPIANQQFIQRAADMEALNERLRLAFGFQNTTKAQNGLSVAQQVQSMTGWVFVAVNRIRNGVARVPMRVYRMNRNGDKPVEITDPKNELVRLIENPNPLDTKSEFWSQTVMFLELTGNAIWLKVRDRRGKVVELWVLPSQYVRPLHTDGEVLWGYEFLAGRGEAIQIPRADIVHIKHDNPRDRFWGWGTLAAAAEAKSANDSIKRAQLKAFDQDILSSLYFSTDSMLDEPGWKRMMANLIERHTGVNKAGMPVLLYGGVKPIASQRAWGEMAFKDSAAFTRDEILGIFGVPPLLAGVVENANNSNTASQERVFAMETIWPRLVQIQEKINKSLAIEFGDDLCVEFDNPVPAERALDNQLENRDALTGILTVNEIREKRGEPKVPWGDVPRWLYELQMKPAAAPQGDPAAPIDQNQVDQNQPPIDGSNADAVPVAKSAQTGRPLSGDIEAGQRSTCCNEKLPATSCVEDERAIATITRSVESDLDGLVSSTVPTLRKYFSKQATRIKANLAKAFPDLPANDAEAASRGAGGDHEDTAILLESYLMSIGESQVRLYPDGTGADECGNVDEEIVSACLGCCREIEPEKIAKGRAAILMVRTLQEEVIDRLDDWVKASDDLEGRMKPKILDALKKGALMQAAALGLKELGGAAKGFTGWLKEKASSFWQSTVTTTTKLLLSEKLARVLTGDTPTIEKLAKAVDEVMDSRVQHGSRTIAVTETSAAYNGGANYVREANKDKVKLKRWVSRLDNRVRDAHRSAHGQEVGQNESFFVGGEYLRFPGDPRGSVRNIVHCRCVSVAIPN